MNDAYVATLNQLREKWGSYWDELVELIPSSEERAAFVWWAVEQGEEDGRLAGHVADALLVTPDHASALAFLSRMQIQDPDLFGEQSYFWHGHPFTGTWRGWPLWSRGAEKLVNALVSATPGELAQATFAQPLTGTFVEIALAQTGRPWSTEAERVYALCWISGGDGALELDVEGQSVDPFFVMGERSVSDWIRLGLAALDSPSVSEFGFADWLRIVPHLDAVPTGGLRSLMMSLDFEPKGTHKPQGLRRALMLADARHVGALEALADYPIEVTDRPEMRLAFEALRVFIQGHARLPVSDEQLQWIRTHFHDFGLEGSLQLLEGALGEARYEVFFQEWLDGKVNTYTRVWPARVAVGPAARRSELIEAAWAELEADRRWWGNELATVAALSDDLGPRVIAMVRDSADPKALREGAIDALGVVRNPEAPEVLVGLLEGPASVKKKAMQALREHGDFAKSALHAGLDHQKRAVRNACVTLLARLEPTPLSQGVVSEDVSAALQAWIEWDRSAHRSGTRNQLADLLTDLVREQGVGILGGVATTLRSSCTLSSALPRLFSLAVVRSAPQAPWLVADLCALADRDYFVRGTLEELPLSELCEDLDEPLAPALAHMLRHFDGDGTPLMVKLLGEQLHRHPESLPFDEFLELTTGALLARGDTAAAGKAALVLQGERVRPAMVALSEQKSKAKRAAGAAVLAELD